MLTNLSLWAIYFASYLVDYALILGILIWKRIKLCQHNNTPFWKGADLATWGILLIFIALSIYISDRVHKMKMTTRIKLIPEKNVSIEMLGYIVAQVITIATTVFSDWWIPINVVLFAVVGIIFVKSKAVHHSPLFVIPLGNRVFESGGAVIITNYDLEELRMAQEDNVDGIEAKELTKNIFYVRKQPSR